eukprot:TRINITY_DN1757_c0_g4_i1.p1 TRINITY_DN1757_c0_g4~~TRINITY_DN1757_c0_g4_i1.p1  ORF type:complete len:696 (-),score=108.52 TRINITY_DN1757_c0_g4_i1:88-2052(-)
MVDDISGVGLRHVGYGISVEFVNPFASSTVEVITGLTDDKTCIDGFAWSLGLMSKSIMRTITEGSTIVMKAINTNCQKAMARALSGAPRGERSKWMLLIQVGSQDISPLAWSIQSGALDSASTMIGDLLTFRADRDRYYYAADDLFNRHPDMVLMLLGDAPSIIPQLFHGLIWRSRLTHNGLRRVNYFIKHLLVDPEGKFAQTLYWILRTKDAKTVCHPTLIFICDLVWSRIAMRSFLFRKSWFFCTLLIFLISQSVAPHFHESPWKRSVIFGLRCFVYAFSLGRMEYSHVLRTIRSYRFKEVTRVMKTLTIPSYWGSWQETSNFALMLILIVMMVTEPILHCLPFSDDSLFTDSCDDAADLKFFNSVLSMLAAFLYFLQCIDFAVFSNRVSAYVLVLGRMISELAMFVLALGVALMTFSCSLSCLVQPVEEFHGVHRGTLTLWELAAGLCSELTYGRIHQRTFLLAGTFVFLTLICVFLLNLLVAQLTCAWGAIYVDMVGLARLKRIGVIVDTMPSVSPKRWEQFVHDLGFENRIEFNEGDVGLNNGVATTEPSNANPTTMDVIKRFGGSTSPDMQWPVDDSESDASDNFDRLEAHIKRAMERIEAAVIGTKKGGGGGGGGGSSMKVGSATEQSAQGGSEAESGEHHEEVEDE